MSRGWITVVPAMLLLLGCDEAKQLEPKEQRISLAATSANICPRESTQQGETQIVATVYGDDGAVAQGVPVTFSADAGSFSESTVQTSRAGQAVTTLSTPRPPGDRLTVFGALADGRSDDIDLLVPGPAFVSIVPQGDITEDSTIEVAFTITSACNIRKIDAVIDWSGPVGESGIDGEDLLSYSCDKVGDGSDDPDDCSDGESFAETGILNATVDGVQLETEALIDRSVPGRLRIVYERTNTTGPLGTNSSATYFRFNFKAGMLGVPDLSRVDRTVVAIVESLVLTPSFGAPYVIESDRILGAGVQVNYKPATTTAR
jgi:hypothetical protein